MYGANKSMCQLIVELQKQYNVHAIVLLRLKGAICDFLERHSVKYIVSHYYWWVYEKGKSNFWMHEFLKQLRNRFRGTVDIINNYSSKLYYWISEPDSGVYHAMNKGIVKANGTYLLFLNSGDYLTKNIVLQKVFSENHTTDIIVCGHNILRNEHIVCTVNPA